MYIYSSIFTYTALYNKLNSVNLDIVLRLDICERSAFPEKKRCLFQHDVRSIRQ